MSKQKDFRRSEKPLEKTPETDNEARRSKKAEMKRKFKRNQKRITPWDIQLSSLTYLPNLLLNWFRWLLPQNENYFLPSTAIRSEYRIPVTSKKELFVAIAFTMTAIFEKFCHTQLVLRGSRSLGSSLIKYYFIITIFIACSINHH